MHQYIEKLSWEQVRKEIIHTIPDLVTIIDDINPAKEYYLYKIKYPFGAEILKNKTFHLPNENGLILPITNAHLPKEITRDLMYNSVPLGCAIKNNLEVYREIDNKVFSVAFYGNGFDFGIWEYFGWTTPYNVSAGARSLYMLPKISSTLQHKKLKHEFGITAPPPKNLYDHWEIFRQLANSDDFPEQWFCEMIIFPKKWDEAIRENKKWLPLQHYIFKKGWTHSGYARSKSTLDDAWDTFARILNAKNLRFCPYVVDTVKQLFFIGTGAVTASCPMTDKNNNAGPIAALHQIYNDCYNLLDYIPTIMGPKYFSLTDQKPVYYSLSYPTLLESVPRSKNITSTMDNIRDLQELIEEFSLIKFDHSLLIDNHAVIDMISKLKFEFFHNKMYAYGKKIRPAAEIPQSDPDLLYSIMKEEKRKFADSGAFVQGCIRITT